MISLKEVVLMLNLMIATGPRNLADKVKVARDSLSKIMVDFAEMDDLARTLLWLSAHTNHGVRKNEKVNGMDSQSEVLGMLIESGPKI
jgi:hypothetical protein